MSWNISTAINKCDQLFAEFSRFEVGKEYLDTRPDIHDLALQIITHADHIRKIMFNNGAKRENERAAVSTARQNRSNFLAELTNGIPLPNLRNARVRNSLAHFDEYLDALWLSTDRKPAGAKNKVRYAVYNIAASSDRAFKGFLKEFDHNVEYIRVYFVDSRKYLLFGREFHIGGLYEELKVLLVTLTQRVPKNYFEPGGTIIVLHDEAYAREENNLTI